MPEPPPLPSLDGAGVFRDVFPPDLSVLSLTEPGNYWRSGSPELGPAYALKQPLDYALDSGIMPQQTTVAC
jgi:hypothetical protein